MRHSLLAFAIAMFVSTASVCAQDHLHFEGKDGPGKGKHVVLIAGDEEYRSEESLPMLAKILSQRHGFNCTVLFSADEKGVIDPGAQNLLTHSEAIDSADVLFIGIRFRNWDDESMTRFDNAYKRGVPIVAIRTSTHAFNFKSGPWQKYSFKAKADTGWAGGFGKQVLGETWVAHHGKHKVEGCRGVVEAANKDHPILRGVESVFAESDVYTARPPEDAVILMRGEVTETLDPASKAVEGKKNDPMQPVYWVRERTNEDGKTNKIVCTTMGAACDLVHEGTRRLVVNGVFWAAGIDVPEKTDVTVIDEYNPSFYGFGTYRKGLTVEQLELGKSLPPRNGDDKDPRFKK